MSYFPEDQVLTTYSAAPVGSISEPEVIPYQFDGRNIRIIEIDGEVWFVAADVAVELGHREAYHLTRLLDEDEKAPHIVGTIRGDQEVTLISEAGLYRAIVQRRTTKRMDDKVKARLARFDRWVFHDVLPTIRKTGGYGHPPKPVQIDYSDPQVLLGVLTSLQGQVQEKDAIIVGQGQHIAELAPKAQFHDEVATAINALTFRDAAKTFKTGRNRFTKWLRDLSILMADNKPYQRFLDAGYFRVVGKRRKDPSTGEMVAYTQTLVTGKGLTYLHKKWAADHGGTPA